MMTRETSLLILSPTPGEWAGLAAEAERAGFDVCVREGGSDPSRPARTYDIVAFDWSDGVPDVCVGKVTDILTEPERKYATVGLVYRPNGAYSCEVFSHLDDMVFPPYEPSEVVARLLRLRERRNDQSEMLIAEDVSIDLAGHEVIVHEERVALTHTEFLVLAHLVAKKGRVVTRDELGRAVWGDSSSPNAEALDVHVRRMRSKLRLAGANPVETVRKVGYRYAR